MPSTRNVRSASSTHAEHARFHNISPAHLPSARHARQRTAQPRAHDGRTDRYRCGCMCRCASDGGGASSLPSPMSCAGAADFGLYRSVLARSRPARTAASAAHPAAALLTSPISVRLRRSGCGMPTSTTSRTSPRALFVLEKAAIRRQDLRCMGRRAACRPDGWPGWQNRQGPCAGPPSGAWESACYSLARVIRDAA